MAREAEARNRLDIACGELIGRIADGDEAGLAGLYDLMGSVIFGLTIRVLRNGPDAEEATLDVFQQVWRRAADYDADRGSPLAWLVTMARSRAIDRLRASQRWTNATVPMDTDLHDEAAGPIDSVIVRERRDRVRSAVERLKPEQRRVLEAAYFGGLSQSETADRLGLPLGTVKTRIRAAMAALRDELLELEAPL